MQARLYPLWLLPIKPSSASRLFALPPVADQLFVDFGIWGHSKVPGKLLDINCGMEKFVREHNGRKWAWNSSYCEEDTFWESYDRPAYLALRTRYKADHKFVDIYEKLSERHH